MIKGAIIALAVLIIGDLAFNDGQLMHRARVAIVHFGAASNEAADKSIFRW